MFTDRPQPSDYPDVVNSSRQAEIERELTSILETADPRSLSIGVRVRHNRDYVAIPAGRLDVSGELQKAIDLVSIGSSLAQESFTKPEDTAVGISSYHVDEFSQLPSLKGLKRIFITAHSATDLFMVSLVKDDDHMSVFFQRSAREMRWWGQVGLPTSDYQYNHGNFKDIAISIPLQ